MALPNVVDAAKGMERQTVKLFDVCAYRRLPVITVVNKWDRPGHEPLALMDEIEQKTGMVPTPLTWPVGIAGDFRGVLGERDVVAAAAVHGPRAAPPVPPSSTWTPLRRRSGRVRRGDRGRRGRAAAAKRGRP